MVNSKIHIGISGGGFAISGLAGSLDELIRSGKTPDVISGVSSGSILTFITCGSRDVINVIRSNSIGFSVDDVFSRPPFNKKGKITLRSISNAIFKCYLSEQDKLPNLLRSFVSKVEWDEYRSNPDSPDGIIMSVDLISGSRMFFNLKNYSYDDAIILVCASSSIPVFIKPVYYKGMILVDGGIRNHILTEWIFDNYANIDESYSIFSRSEDFKERSNKDELKSTAKILLRTIEIMENEISKSDEHLANLKSIERGINHKNFFIENILDNVYDDTLEKQIYLYENGKYIVKNWFLNGGF